jgi:hypothetical protein
MEVTMHVSRRLAAGVTGALLLLGGAAYVGIARTGSETMDASSASSPSRADGLAAVAGARRIGGSPAGVPGLPARADRALVYVGDLTVRVDDVEAAAARVIGIATSKGGLVANDERSATPEGATATLVVRVPSGQFHDTVAALAGLGTEAHRSLRRDDVTEAVADLDNRIATQRASVARTRALFARAERIADIVLLEGELSQREADLAELVAHKRQLDDQVALSTVTLELTTASKPSGAGFLSGLSAGWTALVTSLRAILLGLGMLLPFALALALVGVPAVLLLRRRRRSV